LPSFFCLYSSVMSNTQDILDIAEEAIRCGEKVCTGANVHMMVNAISTVKMWCNFINKDIREELLEEEGIDDRQELLNAIQRLREATLKATK